jgi:hypothetical protein
MNLRKGTAATALHLPTGMTDHPTLLTRWANVTLVLLGLALGLGFTEVSLRLFVDSNPVFDDYDADRGVRLLPGAEGWYTKEGKGYVHVNSLGYRDIEHPRAKPSGVFRIAVLGDSFTEARQVDLGYTFWKLLETKLETACALAGRKVEAMSFGIGGYGTSQELITLEKDVLGFSPDLVLLAYFNGNDLQNNSRSLSQRLRGEWLRPFHRLENGQLALDASFRDRTSQIVLQKLVYFLLHHFRTAELVNQVRRGLEVRRLQQQYGGRTDNIGLDDAAFTPPRTPEWQEAWKVTEALIAEIHRISVKAGARFVLVILGDPIQNDLDLQRRELYAQELGVDDLLYTERRLTALGERSSFPVIALQPRMQQRADREAVYLHGFANTVMGTGHWNETGHRFAAEIIARDLMERGLVR